MNSKVPIGIGGYRICNTMRNERNFLSRSNRHFFAASESIALPEILTAEAQGTPSFAGMFNRRLRFGI